MAAVSVNGSKHLVFGFHHCGEKSIQTKQEIVSSHWRCYFRNLATEELCWFILI
jgi:hypothetical protein